MKNQYGLVGWMGFLICLCVGIQAMADLPKGFVYLHDVAPGILQDMKYAGSDNFVGRPITGYEAPVSILTVEAAKALSNIQKELEKRDLSLKIFDAYRPQMASDDFFKWAQDTSDQKNKARFYPNVDKADFFKLGLVAQQSSHTRGSTVDLTLVKKNSAGVYEDLPMGTGFDFMDESSTALSLMVDGVSQENRRLLRHAMEEGGFVPYELEWWHFTLKNEPFPETYFTFKVN